MESRLAAPPSSKPTAPSPDMHPDGINGSVRTGTAPRHFSLATGVGSSSQRRSPQEHCSTASQPSSSRSTHHGTKESASSNPTAGSSRTGTGTCTANGSSNGRSKMTSSTTATTTGSQSYSPWARLLMMTMLVQTLVISSLEASVAILLIPTQGQAPPPLSTSESRGAASILDQTIRPAPFNVRMRSVPVYASLFACAQLYSMFLAYDATKHENVLQLIALIFFNSAIVVYAVFQSITQLHPLDIGLLLRPPTQPASSSSSTVGLSLGQIDYILAVGYSLPVLATYFTTVVALIAWRLYKEFPFSVYKKIGADRVIQSMYRTYLILMTVLRIDLFFVSAFAVQYLVLVASLDLMDAMSMASSVNVVDAVIVGGAWLIMILLMWLVPYAVSQEHRGLLASSMFGVAGVAAALVYKLMYIFQNRTMPVFLGVWRFLLFFGFLSLALLLCTAILMFLCTRNFGHGLQAAFDQLDAARIEYALARAGTPTSQRRQLPSSPSRRPTTWPAAVSPAHSSEAGSFARTSVAAEDSVTSSSTQHQALSFSRMLPSSSSTPASRTRYNSHYRHTLASTESPFFALHGLSFDRVDDADLSLLASSAPQSPLEMSDHPLTRRPPVTRRAATVHDHVQPAVGSSSGRQGNAQANVASAWFISSFPA
ncbi:hypothetical protein BCR44DRAFT_1059304 [Catenaria anguillulae PL171]|uniref:TRP C-terminal domain-containing protein n=1 Tax=Catenaria anguillulae PL171 TaxID=765915 RepID=A0A1Y2HQ91_9FUNG|nr:hypothetical protein BCR44DRAFT_1059304 [Catenaria anguillulae PL171]